MGDLFNVTVQYCSSWGYRDAFLRLAELLTRSIQEQQLSIVGQVATPTSTMRFISLLLTAVFWLGLLLVLVIPRLFQFPVVVELLPVSVHRWLVNSVIPLLMDYQLWIVIVVFSCSFLSTHFSSTGAFEVYLNDQLIWSKLNTGLKPTNQQLQIIVETIRTFISSHRQSAE